MQTKQRHARARLHQPRRKPALRIEDTCRVYAPGATLVFFSMGRTSFEKNKRWIVAAVEVFEQRGRLLERIKVSIVGPPHHAEAQALLDATIREYRLGDVVVQHPQTNVLEDHYSTCDPGILVSPSEGPPNVAIESVSAGRPDIICATANGERVGEQVTEDGSTGWAARMEDLDHLADTITYATLPDSALQALHNDLRDALSTERSA